jgi:hypothetical protein
VLVACWAAKGGSGTTVVAAALALLLGRAHPGGALLADVAGDAPAALGCAGPQGESAGLRDWLADPAATAADLRARELVGSDRLRVLPCGNAPAREGTPTCGPASRADGVDERRLAALFDALAADQRPVVVDCGVLRPAEPQCLGLLLAERASHSLLVTRLCYLALRRAVLAPVRPTGVVVMTEAGRALRAGDIETTLGVPVVAEIGCDPAVARCVDAGLLATRLPRPLARAVAALVP